MKNSIPSFYLNNDDEHPDGYTFGAVVEWEDDQLEYVHNWVQWCFPLPEASVYQPDSPTLSKRDIEIIKSNPVIQGRVEDMTWRVIDFFDRKPHLWMVPYSHNHLRITRIIKSLNLIASPKFAARFYHFIMWRYASSSNMKTINPESLRIWMIEGSKISPPGITESPLATREDLLAAQAWAVNLQAETKRHQAETEQLQAENKQLQAEISRLQAEASRVGARPWRGMLNRRQEEEAKRLQAEANRLQMAPKQPEKLGAEKLDGEKVNVAKLDGEKVDQRRIEEAAQQLRKLQAALQEKFGTV